MNLSIAITTFSGEENVATHLGHLCRLFRACIFVA